MASEDPEHLISATFPKLILENATRSPDQVAIREKDLGIWQDWSWSDVAKEIRWLACGLADLGLKEGMNLAIAGQNRPRLYWAMASAQALRAIPIPLYQDAVATEMEYVFKDAEINFAIVEDQEQVDKLLEFLPNTPSLKFIIFDDIRGLSNYSSPTLLSYDALRFRGQNFDEKYPLWFFDEVEKTKSEDTSIILYTSGTTGKPKGVCISHCAWIMAAHSDVKFDNLTSKDSILSYLPLAWVGDHLFSYAQAIIAGFTVNCPESNDTVLQDLREIGPTYYFAPPRIFEDLLTQVTIRMEDAGRLKKWIFRKGLKVAKEVGVRIVDRKSVPLTAHILYGFFNLVLYRPLLNVLGLSRVRVAYTAGAAIGPDLFNFYRSLGVNLKQLYGQTETVAHVCKQSDRRVNSGTVGGRMEGVEIKIAEDGEILVKSKSMLTEYYKSPEATKEAITDQGFFKTGDAGFFDAEGQLKIIDRSKDIGKLKDGTMFAPQFLENKLKFFTYVKEAVCFGNNRDKVCAFINIDLEAVGNWAEKQGLAYAGYIELTGKKEVYNLIYDCISEVNSELSEDSQLENSQIRRFLVLHKELDADDDELTRSKKVRRKFVEKKYKGLVEALFEGRNDCFVTTQVKFEDGRSGEISANVKIQDVIGANAP